MSYIKDILFFFEHFPEEQSDRNNWSRPATDLAHLFCLVHIHQSLFKCSSVRIITNLVYLCQNFLTHSLHKFLSRVFNHTSSLSFQALSVSLSFSVPPKIYKFPQMFVKFFCYNLITVRPCSSNANTFRNKLFHT